MLERMNNQDGQALRGTPAPRLREPGGSTAGVLDNAVIKPRRIFELARRPCGSVILE